MKRVLLFGLLFCLVLALAAPALADETIIYPNDQGKKGHVIPLPAGKTLTWKLKAGMTSSTLEMELEPMASGAFKQGEHANARLENCNATYTYGPAGVKIPVKCKMTVVDTTKDAWVKYLNDSSGIVNMHLK